MSEVRGETFAWYLGIDWGAAWHVLCVIDAHGQVHGHRNVAHTREAVHAAVQWVCASTGSPPEAVAVGIERPDGALVDTCLEAGFPMFAINPKQLDRFRDRFTAGGAKDDRRDAQAVADALRTDRRAFHRIEPDDPSVLQLRALCGLLDDLQTHGGRLANRLREQLARVDAAWLDLCPTADEPWLWALLATAPQSTQWRRLGTRRLATVLRAHRIRRLTAETVRAALRQPRLSVAPGVADAVAIHIGALVPQLQLVHAQRTETSRHIEGWLERLAAPETDLGQPGERRDVEILRSLPGVGRMVAATMLTEAAGPLAARDYATLRAHAGTAPVTKRSGKRLHVVCMRTACKARLRVAVYHWARTSVQHDPATRVYYDALRQRGHAHPRALRSVADRWLRILVAMLKTQTPYDAARFTTVASAA